MSFGLQLRQIRESKGISLRDIASATKISVAALEALEADKLDKLPGGIFTRAFVRSYAAEIGIDPDQSVRDFLGQFPTEGLQPELGQHGERRTDAAKEDEGGGRSRIWLLAVGLSVAAVLVFFLTSGRLLPRGDAAGRGDPAGEAALPPVPPAPVNVPPVEIAPPALPPPAPEPVASEGAATGLTIVVTATADCWVGASVDGERRAGYVMKPGQREEFRVESEAVITVGDAGALTFTINGAPGRSVGSSGQVVTLRINKTNFKTYLDTP